MWSDTKWSAFTDYQGQVADIRLTEAEYRQEWESLKFPREFTTLEGDRITVLDGGISNGNAGPDFLDAIILTENDVLKGAVEVHIEEAGWWRHGHHTDQRFRDVILHVIVDSCRKSQLRADGFAPQHTITLPTPMNREKSNPAGKPCERAPVFPDHDGFLKRLGWKRIKRKASGFAGHLTSRSLESLWYQKTLRGLGYGSNHDSLEEIAGQIPLSLARELAIHMTAEQLFDFVLGFLGYDQFYGIETPVWRKMETDLDICGYHYSRWKALRGRPVNHPLFRLYLFFRHCNSWLKGFQAGRRGFPARAYIRTMQVIEQLPAGYDQLFRRKTISIGASRAVELLVNCYIPLWLTRGAGESERIDLRAWADDLPAIPVYGNLKKFLEPVSSDTGKSLEALSPLVLQGLLSVEEKWCKYGRCSGCVLSTSPSEC